MAKVKVLGENLICPICENQNWKHTVIRIYSSSSINYNLWVNKYRHLFECMKCGHNIWFARIIDSEEFEKAKIDPVDIDKIIKIATGFKNIEIIE